MPGKISRRTLIGGVAGAAGLGWLSGCGDEAPSSSDDGDTSGTIKFWDTVWGPASYITGAKALVETYKSPSGGFSASYQSVDWANWFQTFSSALASNTGPAVSSGASTQAYQFYDQGQIAPADNLHAKLEKSGALADFQPGVFDNLHYKGILVAMPWSVDLGCYWYRPSLLEKVGAEPPKNWDDLRQVGLKLKAIGVSGYGISPTPGAGKYGQFTALCMNNGAAICDDEGNPNCLSDGFLEGTDFALSLVKDGIIRPDMVSYNSASLYSEIGKGNVALSLLGAGADLEVNAETRKDFEILPPMTGPSGIKATPGSVQSIMMYTNTPNQEESENYLTWYLANMKSYWDKKLTTNVPILKSITESIKDTSPNIYKAGAEYVPIARADFGKTFTTATARYDASPALIEWAQKIAQGEGTARSLCEPLQKALEQIKQESS